MQLNSEMNNRSLTIFASFPTMPLTDYLPNGDGLVAYQIIDRLAKLGHRVHVATPKAELRNPIPAGVSIYEMNRDRGKSSSPGAFTYMWWTRRTLRRICRTEHVDLIHELNPVFSLRSLAFASLGTPVVLGPHSSRWPLDSGSDSSILRLVRRRVKAVLKDLLVNQQHKRANAVLLSTVAALNNVRGPEDLAGRLFVLPPGIDTEDFSPRSDAVVAQPTILFLANVSRRKGIYSLLDAFGRLSTSMPSVRLTIAGDGPDLRRVQALVKTSPFADKVEFLGRVDRADVPELMHRCSVYCLPSHGEPFGMTAIEAMSCGKALVVTSAGGLAHVISDEGGRRVEVGNSVALSNALEELLTQPELLCKMGEHNRCEAERSYSWPVVAARLEKIYYYVLEGRSAPNPDLVTDQDIRRYRMLQGQRSNGAALGEFHPANHGVAYE